MRIFFFKTLTMGRYPYSTSFLTNQNFHESLYLFNSIETLHICLPRNENLDGLKENFSTIKTLNCSKLIEIFLFSKESENYLREFY